MKLRKNDIKSIVKERYADIAKSESSCCSPTCCDGQSNPLQILDLSQKIGYTKEQLNIGLENANLGLGCGNPINVAGLEPGETVVDLGSGAGFDAFLAAKTVGPDGKVIGVDMTPEMVNKAQENAEKLGLGTVEFRLGEIERLPIENDIADVVVSNCVINLSPDKKAVYEEIYRILKPGGRLSASDVLRSKMLPENIKLDPAAFTG
jgi:SAM-dependent methyltransferase